MILIVNFRLCITEQLGYILQICKLNKSIIESLNTYGIILYALLFLTYYEIFKIF